MPSIALPQNRSKSDSDQPDSGLETADFERKMAQSEIVIRLGRGLELNLDVSGGIWPRTRGTRLRRAERGPAFVVVVGTP